MTLTAPPSASPRRRRRIIQVVVVLAVVLAVALPTWSWRAAVASAQVDVVPGGMTCDGKDVPIAVPGEDDPGPPEYVIPVEKGMNCQFIVRVFNHSSHTVSVRNMKFPALRRDDFNGGPVIVAGNDPSQKPRGHDDDLSATFDVGETLEPDDSIDVLLRLRANPNACSAAGTASLQSLPSTRISVLHRHQTVHGSMAIAVQVKTALRSPECEDGS